MIAAVDLFAGCGGASLGIEAAGARVVAAYDVDPRACEAHRALLPHVDVHQVDLAELDPSNMPDAELWWASPPCQPFSQAGRRRGSTDTRDGYPALLRLARARRPTWIIVENVPGLAQHRAAARCSPLWPRPDACCACYWAAIQRELAELYPSVQTCILDAADYGVPQHRRRLITVCGPRPIDWPEPTHGPGRARPWVSAGEAIGITGQLSVGGPAARDGRGPSITDTADPAPTVRPTADCYIVGYGGSRRARDLVRPAPTVMQFGTMHFLQRDYTRIRTLTVEERARLQCLPWHRTLNGRCVGNAVPPPLAEAVVRAVVSR